MTPAGSTGKRFAAAVENGLANDAEGKKLAR